MESVNPANGELIKKYQVDSEATLSEIMRQVQDAFECWRRRAISERVEFFKKLANNLQSEKKEYAQMITLEMGKPIKQSLAEIEKCAWVAEYYAAHAEDMLADQMVQTEAQKSYVTMQPLGVILAVMPWNFPFWQVFRFAVPTMLAGNTVILKHASNVSGCSLLIQKIFERVGFPENVFRSVLVKSDNIEQLIENDIIKAVTLTGSTNAGKNIARIAGVNLKKCVLELGGSDSYLILDDASIERTVRLCVQSRLINTGQSCIAAKRFIVTESIYDEAVELFKQHLKEQMVGDPMADETTVGPMARSDLRDQLHQQVEESISKGATCLIGGQIVDREGYFFQPTLLTDITPEMPAYSDELFGPVAVVIKANNVDDAVRIANDTSFGLGAAVFSDDRILAEDIAKNAIHAGSVFVNDFVKSDPRLPFGGIKQSGYGRELGTFGILEFVNVKTISIN